MLWRSMEEQLQAHFDKFAPSVVVGDRVGREQPHFKPKTGATAAVAAAAAAAGPAPARPASRRPGLFAKVSKQLGQIREHDDNT